MKCRAVTYHWRRVPCPNEGHVDGYCYLHHPEVMLAKLRYQRRAAKGPQTPAELDRLIAGQESALAVILKGRP